MNEQHELPDMVYHYTSMETLLRIVETRTIRATSIRYLNDSSEREFFLGEINGLVGSTLKPLAWTTEMRREVPERTNYKEWIKLALLKAPTRTQSFIDYPFVASFSKDFDSLPQWRAYCPNGNGVAIGFRTSSLNAANTLPRLGPTARRLISPSVRFSPVRYLTPGTESEIEPVLRQAVEEAFKWEEEDRQSDYPSSIDKEDILYSALEGIATTMKHRSFETEQEFRLVVSFVRYSGQVYYRSSRTTLIPFINIGLDDVEEGQPDPAGPSEAKPPYFIARIVIGPTPNQGLSRDALEQFFWRSGLNVEIVNSRVPYRDTI